MNYKKLMVASLALTLGTSFIVGCGQAKEETGNPAEQIQTSQIETTKEEETEKEQVTIQFWHQGTSQTDTEFVQKCIDSF